MTFDDMRLIAAAMTAAAMILAAVLAILLWRGLPMPSGPWVSFGAAGRKRQNRDDETALLARSAEKEAQNDVSDEERTDR